MWLCWLTKTMTDYERIQNQFESKSVCKHGQKPILHFDGIPWIECNLGNSCKCRMHDGENAQITPLLATWTEKYAHSK